MNTTKNLTIEYSVDGGKTWEFGMTVRDVPASQPHLKDFRSLVRGNVRRHGHGVKTRVVR